MSNDSRIYPKIKMNYLSTDDDRYVAAQGLKLVRKIKLIQYIFLVEGEQ